ncbi:MAG: hypothetical protein IT349_16085 [Candidatus Eisenbacteria bacterium]|nr:hypothetical protein [Candidatus Eisenbacteria bacterium]MCC7143620.1 hypothetical protein [Candidatus Eisenbacteria bacterium]
MTTSLACSLVISLGVWVATPSVAGLREIEEVQETPAVPDSPQAPETPKVEAPRIIVLEADTLVRRTTRVIHKETGEGLQIISRDGDTTRIAWDFKKRGAADDDVDLVRFGEDIVIDEDQEIAGDVIAVGGDIEVRGQVHGDVVSIGGLVRVKPGGLVDGDVVSMGGKVDKAPGGHIGGSDIGLRLVPGLARLADGGGLSILVKGVVLGVALGLALLLGWLVELFGAARSRSVAAQFQDHLWSSLGVGFGLFLLSGPAILLLVVTVIGIPVAVLLPFALLLLFATGFVIVASQLGQRVVGFDGDTLGHRVKGLFAGLVLFAALLLMGDLLRRLPGPLPAIGLFVKLFTGAAIGTVALAGAGAIVLTRFGARPAVPPVPALGPYEVGGASLLHGDPRP